MRIRTFYRLKRLRGETAVVSGQDADKAGEESRSITKEMHGRGRDWRTKADSARTTLHGRGILGRKSARTPSEIIEAAHARVGPAIHRQHARQRRDALGRAVEV